MSSYDAIAALYDPWSRSVTEDVAFYVAWQGSLVGRSSARRRHRADRRQSRRRA
jgi:hypothetical protein